MDHHGFYWEDKDYSSYGWLNIAGNRTKICVHVAMMSKGRWCADVDGVFFFGEQLPAVFKSRRAAKMAIHRHVKAGVARMNDLLAKRSHLKPGP